MDFKNTWEITGRLTRDVEVRLTATGGQMAKCGVAVNYKEKGEGKSFFFEAIVFGEEVEGFRRLVKGQLVEIIGRVTLRNWTGKEGNKGQTLEVIVNDFISHDMKKSVHNNPDEDDEVPF